MRQIAIGFLGTLAAVALTLVFALMFFTMQDVYNRAVQHGTERTVCEDGVGYYESL